MELKENLYKGIEVEVEKQTVKDEDIDREITNILNQNPKKVSVDRPLENGDTALFDFQGLKDGVAFDGGTAENYEMVIGSGQFIPGFEEQMVGMVKGEEKDLEVTFPENYGEPTLAGQPVIFKVKLHDIFKVEAAELNDEFVKELEGLEANTVEELTQMIKDFLENDAQRRTDEAAQSQILDTLVNSVETEIEEEAVKNIIDMEIQQAEMQLAQQGLSLDQYLEMTGSTKEQLEEQIRPNAENRIKLETILTEIIKVENIEVTEEEVNEQYQGLSQAYQIPLDQVKTMITEDEIKRQYGMVKVTQMIMDNAKISYK